jgi:hypothetical protein
MRPKPRRGVAGEPPGGRLIVEGVRSPEGTAGTIDALRCGGVGRFDIGEAVSLV